MATWPLHTFSSSLRLFSHQNLCFHLPLASNHISSHLHVFVTRGWFQIIYFSFLDLSFYHEIFSELQIPQNYSISSQTSRSIDSLTDFVPYFVRRYFRQLRRLWTLLFNWWTWQRQGLSLTWSELVSSNTLIADLLRRLVCVAGMGHFSLLVFNGCLVLVLFVELEVGFGFLWFLFVSCGVWLPLTVFVAQNFPKLWCNCSFTFMFYLQVSMMSGVCIVGYTTLYDSKTRDTFALNLAVVLLGLLCPSAQFLVFGACISELIPSSMLSVWSLLVLEMVW